MTKPATLDKVRDFSLVLGGPIYRLYLRAHLAGPALELLRRRVLFFVLLTWLPLLVISAFSGRLHDDTEFGFLRDIETHVKFLITLPLLVIAELLVHQRIRAVVKLFLERRIITSEELPRFYAAIDSVTRLRNSMPLELALVLLVWSAGLWIWRHETAVLGPTWYGFSDATGFHLRPAGYWNLFISIPIFQLMLLRWYLKLFVWYSFLWRVSRLNLVLSPAHPDRAGGIGFLGRSSYAFSPVLFAQGAMVSGYIANNVLYEGQSLLSYKMLVIGVVALFVLVILGPLVIFSPQLARAKRTGLAEYGNLANDYVRGFDQKWLRGGKDKEILGTADIQSLADLASSYDVVRELRIVPFGVRDVMRLAVATAGPLVPLLLIIMPLEEVLMRIIKIFL